MIWKLKKYIQEKLQDAEVAEISKHITEHYAPLILESERSTASTRKEADLPGEHFLGEARR